MGDRVSKHKDRKKKNQGSKYSTGERIEKKKVDKLKKLYAK